MCRDAPTAINVDEDGNEVGRRWTGRAEETRLREGDIRHAVGCAVAQADGDGGCEYERVSGGSGQRCQTECGEDFFDDKRMLPGR
jgi:hypothetical protein